MVVPLWPLVIQNKPVYQLRWGVNNPVQWSVDNIYIGTYINALSMLFTCVLALIGSDCPHFCQGTGYCTLSGTVFYLPLTPPPLTHTQKDQGTLIEQSFALMVHPYSMAACNYPIQSAIDGS